MSSVIVVTGASGKLGGRVAHHLLNFVAPSSIRLAVRDPSKVADLTAKGLQVGEGDYASPDFVKTLEGVDKLLFVSAPKFGEEALDLHRKAIAAAEQAGVRTIYYTSHAGASYASPFDPCVTHATTQDLLKESGIKHVVLRNGFYADALVRTAVPAKFTGEIACPPDGKVSWTTIDNLAEGIAHLLAQPEPAESKHVFLTNVEAIDFADAAVIVSKLLDKEIKRSVTSDETMVANLVKHGIPEQMATMLLGMYTAANKGDFNVVDQTLEQLIGRTPTSMEDVLKAALSA